MEDGENKRKHLEFIQDVIKRMAYNSFLLKGWSITIISALFVAATAKDGQPGIFSISFLPVILFWLLDGFFLYQEWLFRALYDDVRELKDEQIDFNMNVGQYIGGKRTWLRAVFSKTLMPFHGGLFIVVLIIYLWACYGKAGLY